jgi:hypothetical protein
MLRLDRGSLLIHVVKEVGVAYQESLAGVVGPDVQARGPAC